mmetsp:Transcript_23068/g.22470  ORF Transcript_23068/g.22470 Transcript_23068/m.22470 type:complete len:290 (-) Transcript_23068:340-1209(-)
MSPADDDVVPLQVELGGDLLCLLISHSAHNKDDDLVEPVEGGVAWGGEGEVLVTELAFDRRLHHRPHIRLVLQQNVLDFLEVGGEELLGLGEVVFVLEEVAGPLLLPCVLQNLVDESHRLLRHPPALQQLLQLHHLIIIFVAEGEEETQSELFHLADGPLALLEHNLFNHFIVSGFVFVARDEFLFDFGDIVEASAFDDFAELFEDVEVLGGVAFALLELREVLDHPLHVLNGLKLGLAGSVGEELLDESMDAFGDLSEVLVHDLLEELVLFGRQDHLLHVLPQVRQML